jgi:CubicO group peptidase (beta-lactamase class C family)
MRGLGAHLAAAPEAEALPGFVAAARFADGHVEAAAHGKRSTAAPAAMTEDTLFWIASCTKLATSVLALRLAEAGAWSLDQPVASILPDFADLPILEGFDEHGEARLRPARDQPTLRHLLTHTAGLGYHFSDPDLAKFVQTFGAGPEEMRRWPRLFEAGERWLYSVATDWLGEAIAVQTGQSLDRVFHDQIAAPLGLKDTAFNLNDEQKGRLASMHARLPDGALTPIPFALTPAPNFALGGGGLFSTAREYLTFLCAVSDGRLLGEQSLALLFQNQVGDLPAGRLISANPAVSRDYHPLPGMKNGWSLGLAVNEEPSPHGRSPGSGAWAGACNCYYWVDPKQGVAGIVMGQFLPFADEAALGLFTRFERAVYGLT